MIITDSFVFLNYPKTGSTFVREALSELYKKKQKKRWPWSRNKRYFEMYEAPDVREMSQQRYGNPNPHGTYWQIPERAQHLPVYSVFRDPFRRVPSLYHYADWKKQEALLKTSTHYLEVVGDTHRHIYIYICIFRYTQWHTNVYIYIYIYIYIHAYAYARVSLHICMYICVS